VTVDRISALVPLVSVLLLGSGCSTAAESATPPDQAGTPSAASEPRFTSDMYRYSVTIPTGWDAKAASSQWGGGDIDHTASYSDRFTSPVQAEAFTIGTATQEPLDDFTNAHADWLVSARGCDPPQAATETTLDTTPARRLVFHCPQGVYGRTLVTKAIAVRDGRALILTSFSSDDGTDILPAFEEMLASFRWQP
jgi:hypothetical protein